MKPDPIAGVVEDIRRQGVTDVIVVDNGSTDETALRAVAAGATVVSEPQRGYGRACAAGAFAVPPTTEIRLFLDGDGSDCRISFQKLSSRSQMEGPISLWVQGFGAVGSPRQYDAATDPGRAARGGIL